MLHVAERAREPTHARTPLQTPRRNYRAPKASNQNLLQARKGIKDALHYQERDVKANPSVRLEARRHEQHCLAAIEMLDH